MSENKWQNGFTKTWMLFESGNAVALDLSLFSAPSDTTRPIDAYVVTEVSGSVTYCARRAAGAVYEVVRSSNPDIGPAVAGFDFTANFPVTGESAGLAFAVALTKRLLNKDPGPVAATGIIESSHNGGPIKAVHGIEAKLKVAGMVLPPGGWIFYPKENENQVSHELIHFLKSKSLRIYPVSSVAETIDILFSGILPKIGQFGQKTEGKKSVSKMVVLVFALIAAFFIIIVWKDRSWISKHNTVQHIIPVSEKPHVSPEVGNDLDTNGILYKQLEEEQDFQKQFWEILSAHENFEKKEEQDIDENRIADEKAAQHPLITVSIFGRTRMNAEISKILTDKLNHFFAIATHYPVSLEKGAISGEVVVLRMEENWIENKQNYHSNIKVTLRNFVYKDPGRKIERENIEVTVYAKGMVEDMLPMTAQALMNRVVGYVLLVEEKNES